MAVKLKLKLLGRTHCPFYRLAAMDSRTRRDGRVLEELGTYDPANKDEPAQVKFNADRIRHWLSVGAQPTDTVRHLLKRQGILAK
jgi:small subunit ribosomal protein S16